jgi:hypothetical protein
MSSEEMPAIEIESWKGLEYGLRKPNAILYNKMLAECLENEAYAFSFKTKRPSQSAESLFMALFQQLKIISKIN